MLTLLPPLDVTVKEVWPYVLVIGGAVQGIITSMAGVIVKLMYDRIQDQKEIAGKLIATVEVLTESVGDIKDSMRTLAEAGKGYAGVLDKLDRSYERIERRLEVMAIPASSRSRGGD